MLTFIFRLDAATYYALLRTKSAVLLRTSCRWMLFTVSYVTSDLPLWRKNKLAFPQIFEMCRFLGSPYHTLTPIKVKFGRKSKPVVCSFVPSFTSTYASCHSCEAKNIDSNLNDLGTLGLPYPCTLLPIKFDSDPTTWVVWTNSKFVTVRSLLWFFLLVSLSYEHASSVE